MKKMLTFICLFFILICSSCSKIDFITIDQMYRNVDEEYLEIVSEIYGGCEIKLLNRKDIDYHYYKYLSAHIDSNDFTKCIVLVRPNSCYDLPLVFETSLYVKEQKIGDFIRHGRNLIIDYYFAYMLLDDYNIVNSVGLSNDNKYLVSVSGVEILNVPSDVEDIKSFVCYNNNEITQLICSNNVKRIGYSSFADCYNLKSITLNQGLEEICEKAFYNVVNLEYVVIPSSVEKIGANTFNSGNIFLEGDVKEGFDKDFAIGDANVYYAGQWEYNSEGIPTPLIDR